MRHFFAGASVLVSGGLLCSGYFCDGRNHVCNSGFAVHLSGNVLIHCISLCRPGLVYIRAPVVTGISSLSWSTS